MATQLSDILGARPDTDIVERFFERGEGNPLFTEELLAAGLDGRGTLPPTLRDALMVRVERLSEPAQHVLRVLSKGRRLDTALIADVTGLGPAELSGGLREALASHILAVNEDGWYSFRHALLREAAYASFTETDRSLELRTRDRQRKLISKIDAALKRIDDGTYGYCEETGEPISLRRLDARPIATLSIEAQERHERRERVYRDD